MENSQPHRRQDDVSIVRLEESFSNLKTQFNDLKNSVGAVDKKLDGLIEITTMLARLNDKQLNLEVTDRSIAESLSELRKDFEEFKTKDFRPVDEFRISWQTGLKVWLFVFVVFQATIGWYFKGKVEQVSQTNAIVERLVTKLEYMEKHEISK